MYQLLFVACFVPVANFPSQDIQIDANQPELLLNKSSVVLPTPYVTQFILSTQIISAHEFRLSNEVKNIWVHSCERGPVGCVDAAEGVLLM